jgi:sugar/nucleoside kinase (ribokinase family)
MIAVAGTVVVDVPAHPVAGMPERGGLEAVERIDLYVGGAVANTGMALSRLGVPVGTIGCVGKDPLGRIVMEELSRWADGLWMHEDETHSTSATLVLIHPDGERTFISAVGANAGLKEEHLPWEHLVEAGARAIHLGYALLLPGLDGAPMVRVLKKARDLGLLVSLDVTWIPEASWEDALALLIHVDVFCPNLREAEAITGEAEPARAADALLDAGVKEVVAITLGEEGCYVKPVGGSGEHIARQQALAVDTTGAGDVFVAGILSAWYKGYDWATAARVANVAGATATTELGAAEGVRGWEEVLRLATTTPPQSSTP